MKKTLVPAAALALSLMTVSVGWAQAEEPANCADAITALQRADADHRAAVVADEKAADAEKADDDLERAEKRLADAVEALGDANDRVSLAQARVDGPPVLTGQALEDAKAALAVAKDEAADAKRAHDDRLDERDDARDLAEDTDADNLQDEADKTDAAALKKAVDEARDDFNRLCVDGEKDPSVDFNCDDFPLADGRSAQNVLDADKNDPHQLDEDGDLVACEADDPAAGKKTTPAADDDDDVVVTPSGGVATGGGPA